MNSAWVIPAFKPMFLFILRTLSYILGLISILVHLCLFETTSICTLGAINIFSNLLIFFSVMSIFFTVLLCDLDIFWFSKPLSYNCFHLLIQFIHWLVQLVNHGFLFCVGLDSKRLFQATGKFSQFLLLSSSSSSSFLSSSFCLFH